jgi:hypothetical protein
MAKIRTFQHLQAILDDEMAWRLKDIATFKLAVRSNKSENAPFTRAGVALIYAHWEGFIKSASEAYLNFVDSRGHIYGDLKTCFIVFGLKKKLNSLVEGRKSKQILKRLRYTGIKYPY